MALFNSLFVLMACYTSIVSTVNGKLLCSKGTKVTREAEGDIEFPSASVANTVGLCKVSIYYPPNYEIELTLVNVRKATTYWCGGDYIEISEFGKRRAKYCISLNRDEGNKEILTLKTNAITVRRYRPSTSNELQPQPSSMISVTVHYKMTKPCRYLLTGQTGNFHSPSYPNFSKNIECEWIINTHPGTTIQLTFEPVELSRNCTTSHIEVDGQPVQIICGKHLIRSIQSKSSKLRIRMNSTNNSAVRFKATYKTITSCRNVHIREAKTIQPLKNDLCVKWVLTAPIGQIPVLSFSRINLYSTSDKLCLGNVVEVWNGYSTVVYCNTILPPMIIRSMEGRTLTVTYRSTNFQDASNTFHANFATIPPNKYKANCLVQNMALYFKCGDLRQIPCDFQCDGAMQCPDNSDEDNCSTTDSKWQQLQVFIIVMGSICAFTITFCVGVVCFRKCISRNISPLTDSYGRQCSTSDQAALTPNEELPSPPPRYFNDNDNAVPSIIRGTYFFGNEFSQSGIHSAFLFGIPPPRYRSRESLQLACAVSNEGNVQWHEEMTNMTSRQTSISGDEIQRSQGEQCVNGASSGESHVEITSTEDVPSVDDAAKEETKLTNSGIENEVVIHQEITGNENSQAAAATTNSDQTAMDFTNTIRNPPTNISDSDTFDPMYV